MLPKISLRARIILSYALFGSVIGLVMFAFLNLSYNKLEEQLLVDHLEDEMQFFQQWSKGKPENHLLKTKRLTGIREPNTETLKQFPFLNKLDAGIHEHKHQGNHYIVKAEFLNDQRYYLVYNITAFEQTEHQLNTIFSACVLLAVFGALWYGYYLGGHVIAPVKRLARDLESLPADDLEQRLSSHFANDEVGSLAKSFDAYLERLAAFVQREHYFVSDASHELRTPLAIIQGSAEMLLSTAELNDKDTSRLLRIQRAVNTMSRGIEALLILARDPTLSPKPEGGIALADVLNDVIETSRELVDPKKVTIDLLINDEPELEAPDAIISLLITNLLHNAIRYTTAGRITVTLKTNCVCIEDTGVGITQQDLDRIFERGYRGTNVPGNDGSGLGLSLVKRICEHFSWQIKVSSPGGKGTMVTWCFRQ